MKKLILISVISSMISFYSLGQEKRIIRKGYIPKKKSNIEEKEYQRALYILKNSYTQMSNNPKDRNYGDYWNVAIAYSIMGENPSDVLTLLRKSKQANPHSFCSVYNATLINNKVKHEGNTLLAYVGNDFHKLVKDCNGILANKTERSDDYYLEEASDLSLAKRLISIQKADQKYRGGKISKVLTAAQKTELINRRREIDDQLQDSLVSIFKEYGYPGKSLVGSKLSHVACIVLIHKEYSFQERYLNLIVKAVNDEEIESVNLLKILLDKIYWQKTGKQIFATQSGIPMASDDLINQVKEKYQIE